MISAGSDFALIKATFHTLAPATNKGGPSRRRRSYLSRRVSIRAGTSAASESGFQKFLHPHMVSISPGTDPCSRTPPGPGTRRAPEHSRPNSKPTLTSGHRRRSRRRRAQPGPADTGLHPPQPWRGFLSGQGGAAVAVVFIPAGVGSVIWVGFVQRRFVNTTPGGRERWWGWWWRGGGAHIFVSLQAGFPAEGNNNTS